MKNIHVVVTYYDHASMLTDLPFALTVPDDVSFAKGDNIFIEGSIGNGEIHFVVTHVGHDFWIGKEYTPTVEVSITDKEYALNEGYFYEERLTEILEGNPAVSKIGQ